MSRNWRDKVRAGQTIATLELPEQRQDQAKAEADYQVAKLDYDRIGSVMKKHPGLLAQEDLDKSRGAYEEAKAVYERTKILADYAVIAPFRGRDYQTFRRSWRSGAGGHGI